MSNELNRYFERIKILSYRKTSGSFDSLTERQKHLFNGCQQASGEMHQQIIQNEQIQQACGPSFDARSRSNFVTDFCYNKVNLEDNENKFLCSVDRGWFRFVGFNWQNNQKYNITWRVKELGDEFVVGIYSNGEFQWQFDNLLECLKAADKKS